MLVMMMEANRWLGFITFEFERFAAGLQKWNSPIVVGGNKNRKGQWFRAKDGESVERMEKCYGREGKERWLSGLGIVLVLGVQEGACTNEDDDRAPKAPWSLFE